MKRQRSTTTPSASAMIEHLEPRVLLDAQPGAPLVDSFLINDGDAQRTEIAALAITFNEDVTVAPNALTVHNHTTGTNVSAPAHVMDGSNTVTWDFTSMLEDGYHVAILDAASVVDTTSDPLAEDYVVTFYRMLCDSSGDGLVDTVDLDIWDDNFDPIPVNVNTPGMGDWNLDTKINSADAALWQTRLNDVGLPGPFPDIDVTDSQGDPADHAIDFGGDIAGVWASQTVTVTNTGPGDLSISDITLSDTAQFSITWDADGNQPTVITPGTSRIGTLAFTTTEEGVQTATLTITSDDPDVGENSIVVALSGDIAGQDIDVTDDQGDANDHLVDFGTVDLYSFSGQTVTLTNTGVEDLHITDVVFEDPRPGGSQFSIAWDGDGNQPTVIAPSTSRTGTITFFALGTGDPNAKLIITSDDPDESPLEVVMTADVLGQDIDFLDADTGLSIRAIDYEGVRVGQSVQHEIELTNAGAPGYRLSIASVTLDHPNFAIVWDGGRWPIFLDPGQVRGATITFTPTTTDDFDTKLTIVSNDPDEPALEVDLFGTGMRPRIDVTDSQGDTADLTVAYGDVLRGVSVVHTVTIANTGNDVMDIIAPVAITGSNAFSITWDGDGVEPDTIAPGTSRQATITFTPDDEAVFNGTLTITSDDPDQPSVQVSLSGAGLGPNIEVTDSEGTNDDLIVDFGNVQEGQSLSYDVTVANTGTTDLDITSALLSDNTNYEVTWDGGGVAPGVIAAGASRVATVKFTPSTIGTLDGALVFASNDPDPAENPLTVTLLGAGAGQDIEVTDTQGQADDLVVDFGNVRVGQSLAYDVKVSNAGLGFDLSVTSAVLSDNVNYAVAWNGATLPITISPTDAPSIATITFTPQAEGPFDATFTITSTDPDESPLVVTLNGVGARPEIDVTDDQGDSDDHTIIYGTVRTDVGHQQRVTITNTGLADLNISSLTVDDTAHYAVAWEDGGPIPGVVGPGVSRVAVVTFTPDSETTFNAILTIVSDDADEGSIIVSLSGTGGLPDVNVSDSQGSLDDYQVSYGDVVVGQALAHNVTIENTGDVPLVSLLLSVDRPDYTITWDGDGVAPEAIAVGASRVATVTFSPTTIGNLDATLTIDSDDPDQPQILVQLTGHGTTPDIDVTDGQADPADHTVDYGDVVLGAFHEYPVLIANNGTADLNVANVSLSDTTDYQIVGWDGDGSTPGAITPGATRTATVRFTPTTLGAIGVTLTIDSDDIDEPSVNVTLTGTGVQADIDVTDTEGEAGDHSIGFGRVLAGQLADHQIEITNTGTSDLTITGATLLGSREITIVWSGGLTLPSVLTPGATQTATITFAPDEAATFGATLTIESDDFDEPAVVVTVNGEGTQADIGVTDTEGQPTDLAVAYGDVQLGQSLAYEVTVANDGTSDLTITDVVLSNDVDFSIVWDEDGTPPSVLTEGQSRVATVTFAATTEADFTETLTITSDDPDELDVVVDLTGRGTLPHIDVADSEGSAADHAIAFGDVLVGQSTIQTVTVTNTGLANLIISDILLNDGTNVSIAWDGDGVAPAELAPGASRVATVTFAPTVTADITDTLTIVSDDGDQPSLDVALAGRGILPDIDVTDDQGATDDQDVAFGAVVVGQSQSFTVTVANDGASDLNIAGAVLSNATDFSIVWDGDGVTPGVIAPGASRVATVTFQPTADGQLAATLTIASDDPDESPVVVALSGTGIMPVLTVTDNQGDVTDRTVVFGRTRVGEASAPHTVTFTNTGTSPAIVTSITFSDPVAYSVAWDGDGSAPTEIAVGAARVATITFHPAASGDAPATLSLDFEAPLTTSTVQLSGTGSEAPAAADDAYDVDEDAVLTVAANGVLGNDVDEDPLTATLVSGTANGTLTFEADGSFVYTPGTDFFGTDSFTYMAADDLGDSNVAKVTITVNPINDSPVATAAGGPVFLGDGDTSDIPLAGTDNETPSGDLTFEIASEAVRGKATVDGGRVIYTPKNGFYGEDSFQFLARDAQGAASVPVSVVVLVPLPVTPKRKARFIDADGDPVTVSLKKAGKGLLYFQNSDRGDITKAVLTGTTAKSKLSVKVKRGLGKRQTTLGGLDVDGSLKSLTGKKVLDLTGEIRVSGWLGRVNVDDVLGTCNMAILGAGTKPATMKFDRIENLSLASATPIKSISGTSWDTGLFGTTWVKNVKFKEGFGASIALTGEGAPKAQSIKTFKADRVTGGVWAITGAAGTIQFASSDSGWTSTFTGLVKTFKATRDFRAGTVTALGFNNADITCQSTKDGGMPFGLTAEFINKLSLKTPQTNQTIRGLTEPIHTHVEDNLHITII